MTRRIHIACTPEAREAAERAIQPIDPGGRDYLGATDPGPDERQPGDPYVHFVSWQDDDGILGMVVEALADLEGVTLSEGAVVRDGSDMATVHASDVAKLTDEQLDAKAAEYAGEKLTLKATLALAKKQAAKAGKEVLDDAPRKR